MYRLEEYSSRGGDFDGHSDPKAWPVVAHSKAALPKVALPGADRAVQQWSEWIQLVKPRSVSSLADSDQRSLFFR